MILGVSPDSVASHEKFAKKQGLSVQLLSDPEHRVLGAYGAWGLKSMYGKQYEGAIRSTVLIDGEGVVRRVWPKAKASGHAEEVLKTLQAMKPLE